MYIPAYKYRISLHYTLLKCLAQRDLTHANKSEDFRNIYKKALDLRHSPSTNGYYRMVLPGTKRPSLGHMYFREFTFNSKKAFMKV